MAQIVGKRCARCDEKIAGVADGGFCPDCSAPVHRACAQRPAVALNSCETCGARRKQRVKHAQRAPARPKSQPRAYEPGSQAAPARLALRHPRAWGGLLVFGGLISWFCSHEVGLAWIGWFGAVLGAGGLLLLVAPGLVVDPPGKLDPAKRDPSATGGDAEHQFAGTFSAPMFTDRIRPFPMNGPGDIAVTGAGLELSGFKLATSLRSLLLFVAAVCIACGVIGFFVSLEPVFLGLAAVGGLLALPAWRMKSPHGKPWTTVIPWECVDSFEESQPGQLFIQVRAGGRKEIRFAVDGDAEALMDLLEDPP